MSKYKFRFKTVMLLLVLLINLNSFSQKSKDTVAHIFKYPVKEGYISAKQAYEATTNMIKITEQVINYSMKQGTDAKQILKLVRQWIQ